MTGDYEIIPAMHIGDREMVVGENYADANSLSYLVAHYESNTIKGQYYDSVAAMIFRRS